MMERPFYLVCVQYLDRGGSLAEFVTGPMFKLHDYHSLEECAKAATAYGMKILSGDAPLHTSDFVKQITGISLDKRSYGETIPAPPDSELGALRDRLADVVWLEPALRNELNRSNHDTLADCERLIALVESHKTDWSEKGQQEWVALKGKVAIRRAERNRLGL